MSGESSTKTQYTDRSSRVVDCVAAVFTGLTIWWLEYSMLPSFMRPSILEPAVISSLFVKIGAFALTSLLFFFVRYRLSANFNWLLIAILGVVLTSVADEMVYRATATAKQLAFMPEFSSFPLEIVIFLCPALVLMAGLHYVGLFIVPRTLKYR